MYVHNLCLKDINVVVFYTFSTLIDVELLRVVHFYVHINPPLHSTRRPLGEEQ